MAHGFEQLIEPQPPCRDCLSFERVAFIGDESGPGLVEGWLSGVVDGNGNYWISQMVKFNVYDSQGRFIREVGREGQGPLEFKHAMPIYADESGNVHVFDLSNARETIISSDFTLVGTRPTTPLARNLEPLPGGRYAAAMWVPTPDRIGFSLHVIDGTEIIRSFGVPTEAGTEPVDPVAALRAITTDASGHIISAQQYKYLIEAWTADGERILGLEGPDLGNAVLPSPTLSWENPPAAGLIWAIKIYGGDRLWVLSWVRRENWKDFAIERVVPSGGVLLGPESGTYADFYTTRIDVIDLNSATLVASRGFDEFFMAFLDGQRLVEAGNSERFAIWKFHLDNN
jgi:hypothetical protein